MLNYLRRMLDYDTWANARAIESVRSVAEPSGRLLGLLAHVFTSKRMWLGRIEGSADAGIDTWPKLSLEESMELEQRMRTAWQEYLAGLTNAGLAGEVRYTTATGAPGLQTVEAIISHKYLHAMYHRGQIAVQVRVEGGEPASTDYVVYAKAQREGAA